MVLTLAHIAPRSRSGSGPKDGMEVLTQLYLERCAFFAQAVADSFRSEELFFNWVARLQGRTSPTIVLLDSRGRSMTSEGFSAWLAARRDEGAQHIVFAIGPASGWSDAGRRRAGLLLSLGPMTLAHSLARLVLAEQIYRAFTILSGHPYHSGH